MAGSDSGEASISCSEQLPRGNRKLRHNRQQWLMRKARRKFSNPRHKAHRPRSTIEIRGSINAHNLYGIQNASGGAIDVVLPPFMDFEENYETTVSHLRLVRDAASGWITLRRLGFEDLQKISVAAALVLASEVDRWNRRIGGRIRAATSTWHPEIKRLLCGMGYFELLSLPKPTTFDNDGDTTFLHFLRGTSEPADKGRLAQLLRESIERIVGVGVVRKLPLYEGLSEAITNVGHHAYPGNLLPIRSQQWWLSASYVKKTRELRVLIFDQGVGIPATLPARWGNLERVKELLASWNDAERIAAAMTYGRSSTLKPERGKGLRNLLQFAKAYAAGSLAVYSRRGYYRIFHDNSYEAHIVMRNNDNSIGGTLIEWSVQLGEP